MKTLITLFAVLAVLSTAASCTQEGPAEKAGRKLDNAADKAGRSIEKAGENIQGAARGKK